MNVVLLFSSFSVQFKYMIICMVFVLVFVSVVVVLVMECLVLQVILSSIREIKGPRVLAYTL